ncbi:MAG: cell envelope integrity protein CreD [Bacteroidales bacterium]|nr:cell envelope integrity protein CreD [Bacteroidales bacterium]MBK8881318.1 cell envelope integrity protein CreD [Bacteroidales bacterium]
MKIEITNHSRWHQSITLKLALLAFLGLIFLIPLQMIKEVIMERQSNGEKVMKEISDQWAAKQCFSGPVLNIPVRTIPSEKDEKPVIRIWHILPETLDIKGEVSPEIRYRGIYQSVVYDSEMQINGQLAIPEAGTLKNHEIIWNEAYYTIGITDNRGLKGKIILKTDQTELEAEPGVRDNDIFQSGISFINPVIIPGTKINIAIKLSLAGSEGLLLTPLGKTTTAHLQSDWNSPSFKGSFLPLKRNIDDKGFTADWEVTHLNRNFPQSWVGNAFHPMESAFGVDLFQPVDHYQKSWRSSRYGLLFIALTFLVLIFLEITGKEAIHIFHYFLVSLGLVLFFSLLNSLSEQTGFNIAYLISSAATILMITIFTRTLFREKKRAFIVFGMLTILYSFIFVLLTLNDYAYLAGNIGLFLLLFLVMMLSGRIKHFRTELEDEASGGDDPATN